MFSDRRVTPTGALATIQPGATGYHRLRRPRLSRASAATASAEGAERASLAIDIAIKKPPSAFGGHARARRQVMQHPALDKDDAAIEREADQGQENDEIERAHA